MRLLKYMGRWQLSTPILAIVPICLSQSGISSEWVAAIAANIIGSLIFYKVDKHIFNK